MFISFRTYLRSLDAQEKAKPIEHRRRVPSVEELAHEIGVHPVTFRNVANGNIKQLNLEMGGKIISVMRRLGFPMEVTDLVAFQPDSSQANDD